MPNLKEVKNRIQSVTSTQQITKAMKMVAAAKLRRAQDRIIQMRPYSQKLSVIMSNVSASLEGADIENPYSETRPLENVLLIVIASDRGLCGAFNSNIFKHTRSLIDSEYSGIEARGGLHIMPIGKRSLDYFKKTGLPIVDEYAEMFHNLDFEHAMEAANHALEGFKNGQYDRVEIIFNEFKNVATQILRNEQLLPVAKSAKDEEDQSQIDFIFQPDKEVIFQEIVPKSLKIQLYKALLESNASEQGARMTAMDQATDNAQELLKELRLTYNRTRQAAITKEILEIVGGAEALAQGS